MDAVYCHRTTQMYWSLWGLWVRQHCFLVWISSVQVVEPGRTVDALVHTVDIFNTVLELMGVNVTEVLPKGVKTDSISMVPYMTDPEHPSQRKYVFSEQFGEATKPFLLSLPGLKVLPDRIPVIKDLSPTASDEVLTGDLSQQTLRVFQSVFDDIVFGRSIRDDR